MSRKVCPPDHRHGEVTTCYFTHGCRCDGCSASMTRRQAARYAEKVATGTSCVRCGMPRPSVANLCSDCRYVLSREERAAWA